MMLIALYHIHDLLPSALALENCKHRIATGAVMDGHHLLPDVIPAYGIR
jgi:hypothetical protein